MAKQLRTNASSQLSWIDKYVLQLGLFVTETDKGIEPHNRASFFRDVPNAGYPKKQQCASSSTTCKNSSIVEAVGCGSYRCHFRSARCQ